MEEDSALRVAMSYGNQKAMALIGATLTEIGDGTATIELPVRPDLTQQHGFVHAGIVTMSRSYLLRNSLNHEVWSQTEDFLDKSCKIGVKQLL
jgi:hypothetical protein